MAERSLWSHWFFFKCLCMHLTRSTLVIHWRKRGTFSAIFKLSTFRSHRISSWMCIVPKLIHNSTVCSPPQFCKQKMSWFSQSRSYTIGSTIWVNNLGSNQTCTLYYCCKDLKNRTRWNVLGSLSVRKNKWNASTYFWNFFVGWGGCL